ncbi:MAG: FKBP-type peptidyl-prolyl cis-trans isomerase [Cryomorphaceae bacterium]
MLSSINWNIDLKTITAIAALLVAIHSCRESAPPDNAGFPTQREVNRSMEDINRRMSQEEDAAIDRYIEQHAWSMNKTGTGLRYMIYKSGPEGPLAAEGQIATVNYAVSLVDGTVVYSSDDQGKRSFLIGQDNVESGIHEAIQYLKIGDKAHVILPSHLAHGLTGDNDKIPPRSTVIYDIELLSLR